jgi:peptide/nickel transport system substrate-binding protein
MSQAASELTPMDPVRADNSTFQFNTNAYVRLVNLSDNDEITTEGSLSYSYAIGENGADFYFLLRDDVFFAKVENGHAVNSGERVGAEDAAYTFDRCMDGKSAPGYMNCSQYATLEKNVVITDLEALKGIASKEAGKSVFDVLQENASYPIISLSGDKSLSDNKNGACQVANTSAKHPHRSLTSLATHLQASSPRTRWRR